MVSQSDWLPMMMPTAGCASLIAASSRCPRESAHYRFGAERGKPPSGGRSAQGAGKARPGDARASGAALAQIVVAERLVEGGVELAHGEGLAEQRQPLALRRFDGVAAAGNHQHREAACLQMLGQRGA